VKVNVDESAVTAHRFGVQGIPTLLVLNSGTVGRAGYGAGWSTM
jgi:thioredoxin-like negative regulator of GroEL